MTIYVSLKYMVFAGPLFYPLGGWDDFKGFFETEKECIDYIKKLDSDNWAHIIENAEKKTKAYEKQIGEREWKEVEIEHNN